jgi:hypothetical protein
MSQTPIKTPSAMQEITNDEILSLMINRGLTMEKVLDVIIDANDLKGKELTVFAQTAYFYALKNGDLRRPGISQAEIKRIITESIKAHFVKIHSN